MTLSIFSVAPWPLGGGASDNPSLQSAITGLPDNGTLVFPPGATYTLTAPLQFYSQVGRRYLCLGGWDTNQIGQRGCEFVWRGPSAVAAFNLNYCHRVSLEGFVISCDGSATPPNCGIRVDQWNDPTQGAHSVGDTTACSVSRCLIVGPSSWPFHGLDFSQVSQQNVDLMDVTGCVFNGGAEGIRVGSSSNAKGYRIQRSSFNGCGAAIHFISGSAGIEDCTAEDCGTDLINEAVVDFFDVKRWNSEGAGLAVALGGSSAIPRIESCRWSGLKGPYVLDTSNQPGTVFSDCYFDGPPTISLIKPGGRSAAYLTLDGCRSNNIPLVYVPLPAGQYPGVQRYGMVNFINGSTGF